MTKIAALMEQLKTDDLIIDWEGQFTLFACSPTMPGYFERCLSIFGAQIEYAFIIFEEGRARAYLPKESYHRWGDHLANRARDPNFRKHWCDTFKALNDRLEKELQAEPADFVDRYEEIARLYVEYTAYQVATKAAYDHLVEADIEAKEELEEARKYSEKFYALSEIEILKVLEFLSSRFPRYSVPQLQFISPSEFRGLLDGELGPEPEILTNRAKKSGVFWDAGGPVILDDSEVDEIQEAWSKAQVDITELKGQTAYPGLVTGRCRIIRDYRGASLEEGEILVTGMTDPDFVPLMGKAAAIVTDGGGMLCHAAIVAREMKKPCVIGTKIATNVLKDGDLIEVDAGEGIVRIIGHNG